MNARPRYHLTNILIGLWLAACQLLEHGPLTFEVPRSGRPCRVFGPQFSSGLGRYLGTLFKRALLSAADAFEKSASREGSFASSLAPARPIQTDGIQSC